MLSRMVVVVGGSLIERRGPRVDRDLVDRVAPFESRSNRSPGPWRSWPGTSGPSTAHSADDSPAAGLSPISCGLSSGNTITSPVKHQSLKTDIERLLAVLTSMAEGVIAAGRDEQILFANPAAMLLLDLPDSKLTGRPLWEAVRVRDRRMRHARSSAARDPAAGSRAAPDGNGCSPCMPAACRANPVRAWSWFCMTSPSCTTPRTSAASSSATFHTS